MNRRKALLGLLAAPLVPIATAAQERRSSTCNCVCMEEREGAFVLEGKGAKLSEPFDLPAGPYRWELELSNPSPTDIGIIVDFYVKGESKRAARLGVSDSESVPEYSSGMLDIAEDAEYLMEASLYRSDWKIVLSPI